MRSGELIEEGQIGEGGGRVVQGRTSMKVYLGFGGTTKASNRVKGTFSTAGMTSTSPPSHESYTRMEFGVEVGVPTYIKSWIGGSSELWRYVTSCLALKFRY